MSDEQRRPGKLGPRTSMVDSGWDEDTVLRSSPGAPAPSSPKNARPLESITEEVDAVLGLSEPSARVPPPPPLAPPDLFVPPAPSSAGPTSSRSRGLPRPPPAVPPRSGAVQSEDELFEAALGRAGAAPLPRPPLSARGDFAPTHGFGGKSAVNPLPRFGSEPGTALPELAITPEPEQRQAFDLFGPEPPRRAVDAPLHPIPDPQFRVDSPLGEHAAVPLAPSGTADTMLYGSGATPPLEPSSVPSARAREAERVAAPTLPLVSPPEPERGHGRTVWLIGFGIIGFAAATVFVLYSFGGLQAFKPLPSMPVESATPAEPVAAPAPPQPASAPIAAHSAAEIPAPSAKSSESAVNPPDPLARVRSGDENAIAAFEAKKNLDSGQVLALSEGRIAARVGAAHALRERLRAEPALAKDSKTLEELRQFAADPVTAREALTALSELPGETGPDLLYEIWTRNPKRNATTELAEALVYATDVRKKASPALGVLLDLRRADACDVAQALVPKVVQHGDRRALAALAKLNNRNGCGPAKRDDCYPCLGKREAVVDAIKAVRGRKEPKY